MIIIDYSVSSHFQWSQRQMVQTVYDVSQVTINVVYMCRLTCTCIYEVCMM